MLAPSVLMEDVVFSYPGKDKNDYALNVKYFELKAGERIFLEGESGSGKTTLLALVSGVLKSQFGRVHVLEHEFHKLSMQKRDQIRGQDMGYIFQIFNLIPYLNVFENIALPCQLHAKRRNTLNSTIEESVITLTDQLGITELLKRNVRELSIGQQQRVAAARALIGKPRLIIADEPTSALDHKHRAKFINLLMEQCRSQKSSLIFVSHDPTLAHHFDRSVSMKQLNGASR